MLSAGKLPVIRSTTGIYPMGDERYAVTKSTMQIVEESHRIGAQFLIADLALAMTFLDVAEATRSEEVRRRNRENARTAYEAVQRFLPGLTPTDEERAELEAGRSALKNRLLGLGYVLDFERDGNAL
jgi:hypothetical protein